MCSADTRRIELAQFLRRQRHRASPVDYGLKSVARRRVKGLRREEVAELADISVTWYAWLEQGRHINVSPQALERIAFALHCTDEERDYLFQLAGENPPRTRAHSVAAPKALQLILNKLDPYPAYVRTSSFDIIAWNESTSSVFGDFGRYPEHARNLLWILFTDPSMRELFADWERFARCVIAWFRSASAKSDDPKWRQLLAALHRISPEFRTWWALHEVATPTHWPKELRHPQGPLLLDPVSLQLDAGSDLILMVYAPAGDQDTADRLVALSNMRTSRSLNTAGVGHPTPEHSPGADK
jgi:transcriptional regulator with XRE-family HTH domain